MLQTKAIAAMRMQEKWEKLSWFGWLAILVTLRARLCNHLKSCNLPEDITQEYKLGCAKIAL